MPAYVYECPACGKSVELVQKMSEKKSPPCDVENCDRNGQDMESIISAGSFVLKGLGWARDGYSKVMK